MHIIFNNRLYSNHKFNIENHFLGFQRILSNFLWLISVLWQTNVANTAAGYVIAKSKIVNSIADKY